jgi:hypothetical protein
MVFSSGYLYQYECMKAASTCKDRYDLWKEAEHSGGFPDFAKVEVVIESYRGRGWAEPPFVRDNAALKAAMKTPKFARSIFDQVNSLKLAAKRGKSARNKFLKSLPIWGVDVRRVYVLCWDKNRYNDGGICVSFCKSGVLNKLSMVRLDPDLCLMTGIRAWQYYDNQPLWRP